jgi:ABC-type transport system involved in multi-copper enzyme maturation permease subunit
MNRVAAIAWNTFREAVRNKILYSLLFFAVLIILSALGIGKLTLHEEVRTIRDIGLFGIDLKTVYTILPKPLWRWEFVLGKWLGMLLTLAVQMTVMGAVLALVLAAQGASFDVATAKAVWLLFVNVMIVTSIAVFFSAFSSPFLSGFFALGCFVVGRSVPDIRALGAKLGEGSGAVLNLLCDLVPNLHLFYPSGAIVGAQEVSVHRNFVGMDYMLSTTGYGVSYSLVVLVLAMLVFRKRDFV